MKLIMNGAVSPGEAKRLRDMWAQGQGITKLFFTIGDADSPSGGWAKYRTWWSNRLGKSYKIERQGAVVRTDSKDVQRTLQALYENKLATLDECRTAEIDGQLFKSPLK